MLYRASKLVDMMKAKEKLKSLKEKITSLSDQVGFSNASQEDPRRLVLMRAYADRRDGKGGFS